jgi:hypothetical protein
MPTAAFGREDVETETGDGVTVRGSVAVAETLFASVTVMATDTGPVAVVAPLMTPAVEIDSPAGNPVPVNE